MNEIWKPVIIEGKETEYTVSNLGRLSRNGKILQDKSKGNTYVTCTLRINRAAHASRIHRLVASAFIPNPDNLEQVNHIDGKKNNNRADNLEWCTPKRNIIHSFELGLTVRPKGKESHLYDKGRKVLDANTGITYPSVATAARELGIPRTTISTEILGYRPSKYNLESA